MEVARLIHEGKADVQSDPVLHKACSNDIQRWCYLEVPGHGHGEFLQVTISRMTTQKARDALLEHSNVLKS